LIISGKVYVDGMAIGSLRAEPHARLDLVTAFKPHPRVQGVRKEIPYVPASSWVGVLRHLLEKHYGLQAQTLRIRRRPGATIVAPLHECSSMDDILKCPVCKIFARRDIVAWFDDFEPLGSSYRIERGAKGGEYVINSDIDNNIVQVFVKDEVIVPRDIKSIAVPRDIARSQLGLRDIDKDVTGEDLIRRGLRLEPIPRQVQLVSGIFKFTAKFVMNKLVFDDLKPFFVGLVLLEDRYVGRRGTRGYGRVKFNDLAFSLRTREFYEYGKAEIKIDIPHNKPRDIITNWDKIRKTYEQVIQNLAK